jgi:hypothetical protein
MEAGVKPLTYALAQPFVAFAEELAGASVATARLGGDLLEATMEKSRYLHAALDPLPTVAETVANEGEGYVSRCRSIPNEEDRNRTHALYAHAL